MALTGLRTNARATGIVMVMTAGVLWSTIGIGVRAMESASSYQVVFHRATGQVPIVLAVVAYRYRSRIIGAFRAIGWIGLLGALSLALAYITGVYAVANTSVANAVFAFSSAPIFAAGLGWLVLREPVKRMTGISMGVALVGIVVLTWGQTDAGQMGGNLAGILAAITYAVFAVALRKKKDVDMLPMIAVSGGLAAVISALIAGDVAIEPQHQLIGIGLGAGALGLGLMLFTAGSKYLTTAELPLLAMTETILAPIWVWVLIGEAMTLQSILGGAILLSAVLLQGAQFDERRAARVRPTGAIADAAAAIHVWLAADDGRSDPFGPPVEAESRQVYPALDPAPRATPAPTRPVIETGTPAGGWGTMWRESAQGWVEGDDGHIVWRPIVTTASWISGWEIESYLGVVTGDAWVTNADLEGARSAALEAALETARARGAHALIGVSFDTPRVGDDVVVSATATGVTLRSA